jgi:hypothetical protein
MTPFILPTNKEINSFYYGEIKPFINESMDSDDVNDIIASIKDVIKKYVLLNESTLHKLTDQNKTERTHEIDQHQ